MGSESSLSGSSNRLGRQILPASALSWLVIALAFGSLSTNATVLDPGGYPLDHQESGQLIIKGPGYFQVRDPNTGQRFLTRYGAFHLDGEAYLVSVDRLRVQGCTGSGGTNVGDLRVIIEDDHWLVGLRFEATGMILLRLADGSQRRLGPILLAPEPPVEALRVVGGELYSVEGEAELVAPGSGAVGSLISGYHAQPEPPPPIPPRLTIHRGDLVDPNPGEITFTGPSSDLALRTPGFFVVRDPVTDERLLTRAGAFLVTADGDLATYGGDRVQAWLAPDFKQLGDLNVRPQPAGTRAEIVKWSVASDRKVVLRLADGSTQDAGRIALQHLDHPERLVAIGRGLYRLPAGLVLEPGDPAATGFKEIIQGALELSRIDQELARAREGLSFHEQGILLGTPKLSDLAIDGCGFFLLRRPTDGRLFATRAGAFEFDAEGYFVTRQMAYPVFGYGGTPYLGSWEEPTIPGLRLQGHVDPARTEVGDLRIPNPSGSTTSTSAEDLAPWMIDATGTILRRTPDGGESRAGQVLLQLFRDPFHLHPTDPETYGSGLYFTDLETAFPEPLLRAPGSGAAGFIKSGKIENLLTPDRPIESRPPDEHRIVISGAPGQTCLVEYHAGSGPWIPLEFSVLDHFGRRDLRGNLVKREWRPIAKPTTDPPPWVPLPQSLVTRDWEEVFSPVPHALFRVTQLR